jgi:hypothetical protein
MNGNTLFAREVTALVSTGCVFGMVTGEKQYSGDQDVGFDWEHGRISSKPTIVPLRGAPAF